MWLVVPYAAVLWWMHHLIRSPLNLDYFQRYVTLRCSAALTEAAERPRSRETLLELHRGLERCQGIEVEVDGVWGGIFGDPSVRLKVRSDGGATTTFQYYSVDVSPVLGVASISYGLDPMLYYLNP